MKKRAPPGEANCVVVRHTASDGSKGLHLRAIATMAPGTQLTITYRDGAKFSVLRPLFTARTSWTSSFVLFFPAGRYARAGRPVGSTPLRVRTVFFEAVMFPLHCYPHIVLLLTPRVVSFSPPALIRSSQST